MTQVMESTRKKIKAFYYPEQEVVPPEVIEIEEKEEARAVLMEKAQTEKIRLDIKDPAMIKIIRQLLESQL